MGINFSPHNFVPTDDGSTALRCYACDGFRPFNTTTTGLDSTLPTCLYSASIPGVADSSSVQALMLLNVGAPIGTGVPTMAELFASA